MTREEIMQLNTDYLNGCESEHKMNELFSYALSQEPCDDAEQIDYHDDFETASRKIHDYEERQKQNDKRCGNCKLIGTDICYMVCGGSKSLYKPKQKSEPCDDAISQNQSNACSILDDECPYPHKHCWECPLNYQYELAKHELDKNVELPSVTQKSGKWVLLDECANSGYYCSECHKKLVKEGWSNTVKKIKFCPNCGARMESEDKE